MTPESVLWALGGLALALLLVRCAVLGARRGPGGPDVGSSMTIGGREVQEDQVGTLYTPSGLLTVLADGMGKEYGGRIASRAAVETFLDLFKDYNAFDNPQYYFRKAFTAANRAILRILDNERRGSASVGAAMVRDGWLYYAVVGNVKVCVYRGGDLVPMSAGHTLDVLAEEKFRIGRLSREEALVLLESRRLYNYVGQDGFRDVEYIDRPVALHRGDVVALMSDGVYDLLPWREIEDILARGGGCQGMAFEITERVNAAAGEHKDNASVVLVRWDGGGR